MIDIVELYAASNAGVLLVLLIPFVRRLMAASLPSIRFSILRRLAFPLLIERRHGWSGVTRMEFALLSLYLGWNVACLLKDGTSGVMARSGQMSSINMVTLMLGGRTNMVIDACGIPLHSYYLIHHWVGRIATAQALLHVGLTIASQGWTLKSDTVSGLVAALPLAAILLISLNFIRGRAFEVFLVAHKLLALTAVGGAFWHVYPGKFINLLFPIISLSVWSTTTIYRLYGRRRGCLSDAVVFDHPGSRCAVKFTVRVSGHMHPDPGAYVYLRFSGLPRGYAFQAHPFMIVWYEHGVEVRGDARHDLTLLTFLVQPQKGLTARLLHELHFFRAWRPFQKMVSFDGPYGQDLHLERYETVILIANGMGIAGVLPYARYLALRLHHDEDIRNRLKLASTPNKANLRNALYRDATRKVDILWVLDFNRQEDWISDELRALQDLDPRRTANLIYCYYPEEKDTEPPMKLDEGWRCFYPGDVHLSPEAVMERETGRSRKNVVVACGDATFTRSARCKVLEIMSKENIIEFAEAEYRPHRSEMDYGSKTERPRMRSPQGSAEIELAHLPMRDKNVLSKARGMRGMERTHQTSRLGNRAQEISFV